MAGVSSGSVIVDFNIAAKNDNLLSLKQKLDYTLENNTTLFGAPILDYNVKVPRKIA